MRVDQGAGATPRRVRPIRVELGDDCSFPEVAHRLLELVKKTGSAHSAHSEGRLYTARPGDTDMDVLVNSRPQRETGAERKARRDLIEAKEEERNRRLKGVTLITEKPETLVFARGSFKPKKSLLGCKLGDINLLTPEQYKELPVGTVLYTINSERHIVGGDEPPNEHDTQGGFLAVGFLVNPPEFELP